MCGSLNALALDRALSRLLRRHSILRSRFVEHDHELFVETVADAQATLNAVDLSHLPRDTARIAARQRVAATAAQPFDMAAAPLIRAQALRVATDEHVVHLDVHHAVCDGHSVRQLLSELESFYAESLGLGRPCFAELTDPQTYAVHMRSARQPDPDRDLRFWRTQLANLQLPELPGSFAPGTRAQEDSGSQITLTVDADLLTAVDALDHGQTPFETVLRDVRRKQAVGSTNPLFNTLFEMDHDEAPALYLAGTNATPWHVPFTVPKSDLDLFLQPYDGGLIGTLAYVKSALSPLTAQSIPERLRTVLRAVSDTDSGGHHSRALRLEECVACSPSGAAPSPRAPGCIPSPKSSTIWGPTGQTGIIDGTEIRARRLAAGRKGPGRCRLPRTRRPDRRARGDTAASQVQEEAARGVRGEAHQRKAHSSRRIRVEHGTGRLNNWRAFARREHLSDISTAAGLPSHQQPATLGHEFQIAAGSVTRS